MSSLNWKKMTKQPSKNQSYQFEGTERQRLFLWQHSAINYIYDGKSIEEAVEMANRKYAVDYCSEMLYY